MSELTANQLIPFVGISLPIMWRERTAILHGYNAGHFLISVTGEDRFFFDKLNVAKPEDITPVCRPFDDLTREIEVDGDHFVPVERLSENIFGCQPVKDWDLANEYGYDLVKDLPSLKPARVVIDLPEYHGITIYPDYRLSFSEGPNRFEYPFNASAIIDILRSWGFPVGLPDKSWILKKEK